MNLQPYVKDGWLFWTLSSNGYKFLTLNLLTMWRQTGMPPLLVVCADKPSLSFFRREGFNAVPAPKILPDFGPQVVPFGARHFMSLNRLKLDILAAIAADPAVQHSVYLDGDITVYQNFAADMAARLQEAPLWFQCDEREKECLGSCPNVCTGLIAFNHGVNPAIFTVDDAVLWVNGSSQDQPYVNARLAALQIPYRTLPRELYPNGARAAYTHADPARRAAAFLLHYNYRVGASKRADMKRYGDWAIPY